MQKYDFEGYPIGPTDPSTPKFYRIEDVDPLLDQLEPLSNRIAELEEALKQREDQLRAVLDLQRTDH